MNDMPTVIAAVDIGTNSTRLLVCSVERRESGRLAITDLERHSMVTRLGDGVDSSGRLADEAMERVMAVLERYR